MIKRPDYINRLLKFKDVDIIKILAGVRRSGKSTILDMYKDVLVKEQGVALSNVFQKNYTSQELPVGYNADDMYEDIKEAANLIFNMLINSSYGRLVTERKRVPNYYDNRYHSLQIYTLIYYLQFDSSQVQQKVNKGFLMDNI